MSNLEANGLESLAALDARDVRALTECLFVHAQGGSVFHVYAEDGTQYAVDALDGRCTCPDATYTDPDGGCKHQRRVAFAVGARTVPAAADRAAMDPLLVERVDDHARDDDRAERTRDDGAIAAGRERECELPETTAAAVAAVAGGAD